MRALLLRPQAWRQREEADFCGTHAWEEIGRLKTGAKWDLSQ
jgi:hypothetical protein